MLTASGAARFRPPRRFMSLRRFASGRYRSGSISSSSESSVTKMTVRVFPLPITKAGCFIVQSFTVAGKAYWWRCIHFPQVCHVRDTGPSSEAWLESQLLLCQPTLRGFCDVRKLVKQCSGSAVPRSHRQKTVNSYRGSYLQRTIVGFNF